MGTEPVVSRESGDASEAELKWGDKSVRAKSKYLAEVIAVMAVSLLGVVAYGGFLHMQDTREFNKKSLEALDKIQDRAEMQTAKTVQAIREQTCISALPKDEQKAEFAAPHSWCKSITRAAP